MRLQRILSADIMKYLFVIGVLSLLTLSTTLESLSLLNENSYELVNIDFQEDSEEEKEDKREVDDIKIQHQFLAENRKLLSEKFSLLHAALDFYSNSIIKQNDRLWSSKKLYEKFKFIIKLKTRFTCKYCSFLCCSTAVFRYCTC